MSTGSSRVAVALVGCTMVLAAPSVAAQPDVAVTPAPNAPILHPLDLSGPETLVLGTDEGGEFSALAPSGDALTFYSNVGEIVPRPNQGGRARAFFRAPTTRHPQVAIVVAANRDWSIVDWTVVRLFAQPTVSFAFEPRSSVTLHVGDADFGPVRTDRRGRGRVELLVPPGVEEATAIGTDPHGNTRTESVPLSPPPFARVFVVCPTTTARVFAFAADGAGRAPASTAVSVTSGSAQVASPERHRAGYFESGFSVPPDGEELPEFVATIVGDAGPSSRCRLSEPPEAPQSIAVTLDRATRAAGSGPVELTIEVRYPGVVAARRGVLTPEVTVDVGEVGEVTPGGEGRFQATWSMPDAHEGRTRATARVVARSGSTTLEAEASTALTAGPPRELQLTVADEQLVADGRRRTTLQLRVRDAHGNIPAELDPGIEAHAEGSVGPFQPAGSGLWTAEYRAPLRRRPGVDRIEVGVPGGTTGVAEVGLLTAGRPIFVDLRAGYLTNFGKVRSPLILAGVGYRLPPLEEAFSVGFTTGFFLATDERRDQADTEQVALRVWGVPLLLRASYRLSFDRVDLNASLLGGAVLAHRELSSPSSGVRVERDLVWAVGGSLGASFVVGPGGLLIELGYLHVPASGFVDGNLAGMIVLAGYALDL